MKKTNDKRNILIIAASETDANLYYATGFVAPDPFVFIQIRGKQYLWMSDLELDRARLQSRVDRVLSVSQLVRDYEKKHRRRPGKIDLIVDFLKTHRAKELTVPGNFPIEYFEPLKRKGFRFRSEPEPFFKKRTTKTPAEIRAIQKTLRYTEKAVSKAIQTIKKSAIKKGRLYLKGTLLTSEAIKKIINVQLMEHGCIAAHSIVSCGKHSIDPHEEGSGPLYAHQPIIIDVFPRDSRSRYFADLTRTVIRGKASPQLKKMYSAVKEAQAIAFRTIRDGADSNRVHAAIQEGFQALGFRTGLIQGRMQGFFHGTGHGLGLEIHESPNLGVKKDILRTGNVVTVEPGLYYKDTGGVRLEDVVVVTKTGCKNLTRIPKTLEL